MKELLTERTLKNIGSNHREMLSCSSAYIFTKKRTSVMVKFFL